jgi:hypothetical protein
MEPLHRDGRSLSGRPRCGKAGQTALARPSDENETAGNTDCHYVPTQWLRADSATPGTVSRSRLHLLHSTDVRSAGDAARRPAGAG